MRDVALLPTGGEVLLGVLNNDTDPSGGILVIQSVSVEPGSGISVSVLNHESLRIGDQGALDCGGLYDPDGTRTGTATFVFKDLVPATYAITIASRLRFASSSTCSVLMRSCSSTTLFSTTMRSRMTS